MLYEVITESSKSGSGMGKFIREEKKVVGRYLEEGKVRNNFV